MTSKEKERNNVLPKKAFTPSPFHIEIIRIKKNSRVVVSGIISVSEFSENAVHLISHGGRISFMGSSLTIAVLENKTVEIIGKVDSIGFE